jgi:hypothetical protein
MSGLNSTIMLLLHRSRLRAHRVMDCATESLDVSVQYDGLLERGHKVNIGDEAIYDTRPSRHDHTVTP